jgi:hypothetical protein
VIGTPLCNIKLSRCISLAIECSGCRTTNLCGCYSGHRSGTHMVASDLYPQLFTEHAYHHLLLYLQDKTGHSHLAVVGTDPRGSGHFTYVSAPNLVDALKYEPQPLKCTNRCKWVAMIWCMIQYADGKSSGAHTDVWCYCVCTGQMC